MPLRSFKNFTVAGKRARGTGLTKQQFWTLCNVQHVTQVRPYWRSATMNSISTICGRQVSQHLERLQEKRLIAWRKGKLALTDKGHDLLFEHIVT